MDSDEAEFVKECGELGERLSALLDGVRYDVGISVLSFALGELTAGVTDFEASKEDFERTIVLLADAYKTLCVGDTAQISSLH